MLTVLLLTLLLHPFCCCHFRPHSFLQHHAAQIAELKQDITLFGTELTQWGAAQRAHLLASILHSADIANCVKPLPQSTEWAKRVSEGKLGSLCSRSRCLHQSLVIVTYAT